APRARVAFQGFVGALSRPIQSTTFSILLWHLACLHFHAAFPSKNVTRRALHVKETAFSLHKEMAKEKLVEMTGLEPARDMHNSQDRELPPILLLQTTVSALPYSAFSGYFGASASRSPRLSAHPGFRRMVPLTTACSFSGGHPLL